MSTTSINRRSFLKVSALVGGGFTLGFNWVSSAKPGTTLADIRTLNAFLSIDAAGLVTIQSPNPEIGQGIKTAMPMIVAEELDIPWEQVKIVQAPLDTVNYQNQFAGGSLSIKRGWDAWREAGATAREILKQLAADRWNTKRENLRTQDGKVWWEDRHLTYAELAASTTEYTVPENVSLKDPASFRLIGTARPNVDNSSIVSGKPLFGLDFKREGMKYAVIARRPAFGMKLANFDATKAKAVNGVLDVVEVDGKVAVVANSTWAAISGRKALEVEWEVEKELESSQDYDEAFLALLDSKKGDLKREDGEVDKAFEEAAILIEREYQCPFLPHNALEPMNFFAHVREDGAELIGPTQTPGRAQRTAAGITGLPVESITVEMTRMGGGFGRRLSADYVDEAVRVSQAIKGPVKVIWTREDDMGGGIYRNAARYRYRAALDTDNQLTAFEVIGVAARTRNATRHHNFPAAAIPHYRATSHSLDTNVTTGAWRAPIHNFVAVAEQMFMDELALKAGQDPLDFRLNLLEQAKKAPVGELEYEPDRFIGVLKLAAEKANWGKAPQGVYQGLSVYFSHYSYVAEIAEITLEEGKPKILRYVVAADCGILINPSGALNQVQGGIIDGLGHTLYSELSLKEGRPEQTNFHQYRMMRIHEAPPKIEVHFVPSTVKPTGLGEPALPPAPAAFANAVFAATGQRWYMAPFLVREQEQTKG